MPTRSQCSACALIERLRAALVRRKFSCICSEILTIPTAGTLYMICRQFVYYQCLSKTPTVCCGKRSPSWDGWSLHAGCAWLRASLGQQLFLVIEVKTPWTCPGVFVYEAIDPTQQEGSQTLGGFPRFSDIRFHMVAGRLRSSERLLRGAVVCLTGCSSAIADVHGQRKEWQL